jgi:3'-phosphoadenosine 5'-phosphosulfate sulfotransferase (PAPS reductase)/FAD synthetase
VIHVLSISGGKDSAAMWAWAKRTGLTPRVAVACDTGWEASFPGADWLTYVAQLSSAIGDPIRIVRGPRSFAERVRAHNTFPGRVNRRWCTQELKLEPFRDELDRIREEREDDVEVYVGVRAEESHSRAKLTEREWSDFYDCYVSRPLISWTTEDVIREHHAAGIPLNPLYRLGAERVGCWPCIKAGKLELRLVADLDPARIEEIRTLERETGTTMFCLESSRAKGAERKLLPTPIDGMIEWARTDRGGRQLPMFHDASGCARWGICEAPRTEDDGAKEDEEDP